MPRGRERHSIPRLPETAGSRDFDLPRIQQAVRQILIALGENPDRDGLRETPSRFARACTELFSGLREDPAEHLSRTFEQESEDLVVLRDIEFASTCEHHLLPVLGRVHIAYLPADSRVVGLSKLARTVDIFARRPQLQERFTAQIADSLIEHLSPRGVAVVVEAEHFCMKVRGVQKANPVMSTTAVRGLFAEDWQVRQEVLAMLGAFPESGGRPATLPEAFGGNFEGQNPETVIALDRLRTPEVSGRSDSVISTIS